MKKIVCIFILMIITSLTNLNTGYAIPLSEAVDDYNNYFTFMTWGDSSWFGQTVVSFYDGDAAQSGTITDGQSTLMEAAVSADLEVQLSFFWKVSSESDCDFLIFYIDDVEMDRISGEIDWQKKEYSLSAGPHCLRWVYSKNNAVSSGLDAGWIDLTELGWLSFDAAILGHVIDTYNGQPIIGALVETDMLGGRVTSSDIDGLYELVLPTNFSEQYIFIKASAEGYYDRYTELLVRPRKIIPFDFYLDPLEEPSTDEDQDIIPDVSDNCPNNYNPQQLDADHDGIGDVCDSTPGCGSGCGQVACETPYPTTTTTSVQVTTSIITTSSSSTSTTTSVPVDTDHDGIPDVSDNCPSNCNQYQLDADRDGIGDVCDSTPGCGGCGAPNCEVQCSL